MESPLTSQRATTIASRVLCVFFLTFAVVNFLEIPSLTIGLLHYRSRADGAAFSNYDAYWVRRYALWIIGALGRGAVEFWLAGVFYRVGPKAARFLLGQDKADGQFPSRDETVA